MPNRRKLITGPSKYAPQFITAIVAIRMTEATAIIGRQMIKHRKRGFFRIAAAILMICFTLFGLTACAGTTDSKDNNDDNALIQGTWEIDTGSGAGYKFVDDKFMWLKSIENVNDNYWYGDVEYYNGAEAMEIAGLTEEELKSSLPGLKPENIFVTKLDPEKIITDGEDKTA